MKPNILNNLFSKVDISTIVLFRISFGFIMLYEIVRYFQVDWIGQYWIEPAYNFPYWPFLELEPLGGNGMYILFGALGVLSACIMLGLFYRISSVLFFLGFSYMFLLEQTRYLNHFYLICLISFVLIFIPAHHRFSLDVKLFDLKKKDGIDRWCLYLLQLMIGIPFFYGGLAKINSDWLAGQPLQIWLSHDLDFPLIGQYFDQMWMIHIMSYSGLLLDLLIVPFLLIKRTRIWAFIAGFLFHVMNSELFVIGIFPWFMIASTSLFFEPDWPKRFLLRLKGKKLPMPKQIISETNSLGTKQKAIIVGLALWTMLMLLVPLRHFTIPGKVSWTEDGHKFSWHMKLRTKRARGAFDIISQDGSFQQTLMVGRILESWQIRKALARPPVIWQLAQKIKEDYAAAGRDVKVFANIEASLNGRPYQQFTDPNVDLTIVPYPLWKTDWILPLTTPLPKVD